MCVWDRENDLAKAQNNGYENSDERRTHTNFQIHDDDFACRENIVLIFRTVARPLAKWRVR
jgi:hypothetical protein